MAGITNKYALIYEFNKESPLFTRVAYQFIKQREYNEAITVLKKGIGKFPEYPTAYYLYAIALANLGERKNAIEMVLKAVELHGTKESLKFYTNFIEKIVSERADREVSNVEDEVSDPTSEIEVEIKGTVKQPADIEADVPARGESIADNSFEAEKEESQVETTIEKIMQDEAVSGNEDTVSTEESDVSVKDESRENVVEQEIDQDEIVDKIIASEAEESGSIPPPVDEQEDDFENELDILAAKLEKAVLPRLDADSEVPKESPDNEADYEGKSLVSETLAKIHFSQGNFTQALSIYETLIDVNPDKKEFYEAKIAQIKSKL